ncbi:predicted protein [Coccidioides posadasii str. Silveira]|uniref:Predicted protein n=1 Tax=Coccidioides posadasii (strain RMSCC 757 / Silveira) TaxID=443226 RepID=E9CSC4_COCPS|nr:predicted protein [Coccidioides posadasii str. Silveira]
MSPDMIFCSWPRYTTRGHKSFPTLKAKFTQPAKSSSWVRNICNHVDGTGHCAFSPTKKGIGGKYISGQGASECVTVGFRWGGWPSGKGPAWNPSEVGVLLIGELTTLNRRFLQMLRCVSYTQDFKDFPLEHGSNQKNNASLPIENAFAILSHFGATGAFMSHIQQLPTSHFGGAATLARGTSGIDRKSRPIWLCTEGSTAGFSASD